MLRVVEEERVDVRRDCDWMQNEWMDELDVAIGSLMEKPER